MWDWRYPINDIRNEVSKTRTNGEKTTSLDNIDKLLNELTTQYELLEKEDIKNSTNDKDEFKEYIQKQRVMITASYEQAKQYSNIIILGGYAGLFTIWNFTKDTLSNWQVWSVGLLIITSLLIYLVFELYGAWLRTTQVNNQMKELAEAERLNEFSEEYGKSEMSRANLFMKIWPFFFFGAITFALGATTILIFSFIKNLICLYV